MGRTIIHFHRQSQAEFAKKFTLLCKTKSSWQVWADFLTLSAIAISNLLDREGKIHDDREKEYLSIIKQYSPQERQVFPELLALLTDALNKEPKQDFLGEMFMSFGLGNHWKGQFFTSYTVCQLIAGMNIENQQNQIQKQGWISINDPCCGAGALLIAARNEMVKHDISPQQVLYVAQDIDRTAALMCYLQLSLLGCAGYVIVGDTLIHPSVSPTSSPLLIAPPKGEEVWLMPAFYDATWVYRVQFEKLKMADNA